MTLIEVVICVILLAVVITPLAGAMDFSWRNSQRIASLLDGSTSRQQLASTWTEDVASVDPAGANTIKASACRVSATDPASSTSDVLITFNATEGTGPSAVVTRTSYWKIGNGTTLALVRIRCTGIPLASYGQPAYGGTARTMVQNIGRPGDTRATTFTFGVPSGAPTKVCDETTCAVQVNGRHSFRISAQRRVYGAGVPTEAGYVYSSSGLTYPLSTVTGPSTDVEKPWGGRITLAPGLDGPSALTVQVAIQQAVADVPVAPARSGGRFYRKSSGGTTSFKKFDLAPPAASAAFPTEAAFSQNQMSYDSATATWYFDLPVGDFSRGGEYRIWTRLKVGSDVKQYGGAAGFPIWVDWNPSQSVFVSNGDGTAAGGPIKGDDSFTGTTPVEAVATVAEGLRKAGAVGRPDVLVLDNGKDYDGLDVAGPTFPDNRVVTGGIDKLTLLRTAPAALPAVLPAPGDPTDRYTGRTTIRGTAGTAAGQANTGVVVDAHTGITLRHVYVDAGPQDAGHLSSYGIRAVDGASVTIQSGLVRARDGLDAAPTGPGSDGANGANGCFGNQPIQDVTDTFTGTWKSAPLNAHAANAPCSVAANDVRAGGRAGGGSNGGSNGKPGEAGGPSASGAPGGAAGSAGSCVLRNGQNGGGGGAQATPQSAPAPASPGSSPVISETWTAAAGNSGPAGRDGRGGAGGGGGGGVCGATSEAGGPGGHGGLGGSGGAGGVGGGGSFAVYVAGAGSSVTIDAGSSARAASGGDGAAGGLGGLGGVGGTGGKGQAETDGAGEGGGGGGGEGGGGGGGGAGGEGGWSVAVFADSAATATVATTDLQAGTAGTGGPGGGRKTFTAVQDSLDADGDGNTNELFFTGRPAGANGGPGGEGAPAATASFLNLDFLPSSSVGSAGGGAVAGANGPTGSPGNPGQGCVSYIGGTCA